MAKGYIRGRETAGVHETHHHVMPVRTYVGVFGALLVLTVLTVAVSEANLGSAGLFVALIIAAIKSGFVIGFFMHLKYDTRFHSFVFFGTLLFIGIFFLMVFIDIDTRGLVNREWGNHAFVQDHALSVPPAPVAEEPATGEATELKSGAEVKDGEATTPEATTPEATKPEATKPEATKPEATTPNGGN